MKRITTLRHEFVEFIPEPLEDGVIYISIQYATASHNCCCGCGKKVVTPISPTDWKINFDGKTISLYPSIGSWSLPCRSHYWIAENKIEWAEQWSDKRIQAGRAHDSCAKQDYYKIHGASTAPKAVEPAMSRPTPSDEPVGLFAKLKKWWSS